MGQKVATMTNQPKTAKRRRRKAGSIEDAKRLLWRALERAGELLDSEDLSPDQTLKALHAISQGAGAYSKVLEVSDFAARLEALEKAHGIDSADAGPRLGKGAA